MNPFEALSVARQAIDTAMKSLSVDEGPSAPIPVKPDYAFTDEEKRAYHTGGNVPNVIVDGQVFRRMFPAMMPGDYYWIARGVRDVMDNPWLIPADMPINFTEAEKFDNIRAYQGKLNKPVETWPKYWREHYEAKS